MSNDRNAAMGNLPNITLEEFHGWLEKFDGDAVVGQPHHGLLCPLARCLRDLRPGFRFAVSSDCIIVTSRTSNPLGSTLQWIGPEPWQKWLMIQVDRTSSRNWKNGGIPAGEVRLILARYPESEQS